jgi:SAM-dependent methyltransferase
MTASLATAELAKSYARWRSSPLGQITDRIEQELLFELLGPAPGKTLLDVGCGDAAFAMEFIRRGGRATGLDADPAMVAAARQRTRPAGARICLVAARAQNLPFKDATFDRVLAVTTLCFVHDAARAVEEMARVLKPGGSLVIGELGRWSFWSAYRRVRGWLGDPIWRVARFATVTKLRDLAQAAGLDVVTVRGAIHYPPCELAARFLAPVDLWLGRKITFGSAFIVVSARKPAKEQEQKPAAR